MPEVIIDADAWYDELFIGESNIVADAWYNDLSLVEHNIDADAWYDDLGGLVPPVGVGVGPIDLIYLEKLYEVRVHIGGGANWNYTRFGLRDALWTEDDPWVEIGIPQGTPANQHMEIRNVRDGRIICYDDKAVYTLFRNTDVKSEAGDQYLLASISYPATKVVFIYKGTRVIVATGVESECTVYYTFTNFRIGKARSDIGMDNRHFWEIDFKADSVERSEA